MVSARREELGRRLDRLAESRVPGGDRAVDRSGDLQQVLGVVLPGDPGEVAVVEAEVAELLLGVQQGGLGLVEGRQGFEFVLRRGGLGCVSLTVRS